MHKIVIDREQIIASIEQAGHTDSVYLAAHLQRFINTYHQFDSTWDRQRGIRMLDIGAHWLHQSMVFRLGGYEVTSADLPVTLEQESVRSLAKTWDIDLVSYQDLSRPDSLAGIETSSMNIILMAEIIEHITFNPVEMWKEVYRVLAPWGRIIVTTPNYYWAGGKAWMWKRFAAGGGGGITADEVLNLRTLSHHWKEYSERELRRYFSLLSPDFKFVKVEYTSDEENKSSAFQKRFRWFRQGLHIEVDVEEKVNGINIVPTW